MGLVDRIALELINDFQHAQKKLLVPGISLPRSKGKKYRKLAIYNMQTLVIMMFKDIVEFPTQRK